jgi:hypothetical protein
VREADDNAQLDGTAHQPLVGQARVPEIHAHGGHSQLYRFCTQSLDAVARRGGTEERVVDARCEFRSPHQTVLLYLSSRG